MKTLLSILVAVSLTGCAIVEDQAPIEKAGKPIVVATDVRLAEQGVVTAATLYPVSDVAIIPSETQHVVWRRTKPIVVAGNATVEKKPTTTRSQTTRRDQARVIDNWPVLEEDMNMDSEIGRVDMCRADNSGCLSPSCAKDLVPCENPNGYECFQTKIGSYCLEEGDGE